MNKIKNKDGISTYAQVKELLKKRIINGELLPGQKLQTERELAHSMSISRSTASAAYQLLEKEGYIQSIQGKGTFVREDLALPTTSRKEKILESIDQVIDLAIQLGFSTQELASFMNVRIFQYGISSPKFNLVFIDCNEEQTFLFARKLEQDAQISVQSILLDELPALKNSALIRKADLIVTTIRHLDYVKEIIDHPAIITIATTPSLEGLVQIGNVARTQKIGLVCSGSRFRELFFRSMDKAGIPVHNIRYRADAQSLDEFIHEHEILIVTPLMEKEVNNLLTPSDTIHRIVFYFEMDASSVNLVNERIATLKMHIRKNNSTAGN